MLARSRVLAVEGMVATETASGLADLAGHASAGTQALGRAAGGCASMSHPAASLTTARRYSRRVRGRCSSEEPASVAFAAVMHAPVDDQGQADRADEVPDDGLNVR